MKILQVVAVGGTVWVLLMPLLERLRDEGYDVHVACAPAPHLARLRSLGFQVHPVPIARVFASLRHAGAILALRRLIRRERYDVVHVHTPVAAALGRIAARMARTPHIFYTAHGYYFHDNMPRWRRRVVVGLERWLGRRCTDHTFTQSAEDRETAVREGIAPSDAATWIGNGVDLDRFVPGDRDKALMRKLGLDPSHRVIGFIGRIVREKGIRELLEATALVAQEMPEVRLLLVGGRMQTDRDRRTVHLLDANTSRLELGGKVLAVGPQEDVAPYLTLMDVFALPSYREGMPRTILEAMASGKPVVATDIRGCREEVVDGVTGYLVPVRDTAKLASAIRRILSDSERAEEMGMEARRRAEECFSEPEVLDRQIAVYRRLLARV
ncbi:glycosyltransferase family 4 protein [Candidatus Bipolaricaulota bacterium]